MILFLIVLNCVYRWYQTTDSSLPHATRVNIAKHNVTTWVGTTIHSVRFVLFLRTQRPSSITFYSYYYSATKVVLNSM